MRLPAVALAVSFSAGILLGGQDFFLARFSSPSGLFLLICVAVLAACAGFALAWKNHLLTGALCSVILWTVLGSAAAAIAHEPLPAHHILPALASKRLELSSPLRWHGRLREEPRELAWGTGMDVDLDRAEYEGAAMALTGGLRLTFPTQAQEAAPLPDLHAGDEIKFTTKARMPAIFRDDGAFDRRAYLASQGIHLVANLRAVELIELDSRAPRSPRYLLARLRAHLRRTLDALFPASPESAAILRAMLLGDRSFVDRDESKSFQITGTYHVLVVAGLHVTAIAVFLFWIGKVLRLPRVFVALASLAALAAYVAIIEQRPPVLRAALMAGIVVLGRLLFRRLDLLNSAALAALLILLVRPLELFDPSFQFSFLAMVCIGGVAVPWLERTVEPYAHALRDWRDVTRDLSHEPRQAQFRIDLRMAADWLTRRFPKKLQRLAQNGAVAVLSGTFRACEIFVLSLVLQAGMLPLMAQQFHRVAISGALANLFAVPLTGILVPLGILALAAGVVLAPVARVLAVPLGWLTALLLRIVAWFAHFPRWSYRIPGPPIAVVVLFLVLLAVLAAMMRFRSRWTGFAAAGLIACGMLVATYPFAPKTSSGSLELTAIDVGQGDSLLAVSPHGGTLLIDAGGGFTGFGSDARRAGPDPGEEAVSPYLWSRGFQRLDIVALTHAHHDHIGGMAAILENFRVGRLWIGREVSSSAQTALEDLARSKHIPIEHEQRGQSSDWDTVKMQVLWPELSSGETFSMAQNNDSLVLRLSYGRRTFLLAGDLEKQAEREIVSGMGEDALRADVLKVGHHGSKNSTTEDFLARVSPQLALISAGAENTYGHPNAELLERLRRAGVRTLRTNVDGAIHVLTDGKDLEVSCFVPCAAGKPGPGSR